MKTVILCGGLGTRISEETAIKPKPMVEIGGRPVLWHIMKLYSHYGFREFVLLLGYKGYLLKEYFANYFLHQSDITFDLAENRMKIHNSTSESWKVTLLDTGTETMTGGRILQARSFIGNEPFMLTYGDGVSDVNLEDLLRFHRKHGKTITMTSIQPEGRYGSVDSNADGQIKQFLEKPKGDGAWINGGFFVCQPELFDYLKDGDETIFERSPLEALSHDGELYAYKHTGFWKCMDTLRDKVQLNELWEQNRAKWRVWE
jgi:glucose-1-phosphate cytidylyltransferase